MRAFGAGCTAEELKEGWEGRAETSYRGYYTVTVCSEGLKGHVQGRVTKAYGHIPLPGCYLGLKTGCLGFGI